MNYVQLIGDVRFAPCDHEWLPTDGPFIETKEFVIGPAAGSRNRVDLPCGNEGLDRVA